MSREEEVAVEQAYADWAQERIDVMLEDAEKLVTGAADKATAGAGRKLRDARARELGNAREALLIGRLDMVDDETFYVGKTHVNGGDITDAAVIDWRTPMGNRFYEAGTHNPLGVGRHRTILMRGRSVTSVSDKLLTASFQPPAPIVTVAAPPVPVVVDKPSAPTPAEPVRPAPVVDPSERAGARPSSTPRRPPQPRRSAGPAPDPASLFDRAPRAAEDEPAEQPTPADTVRSVGERADRPPVESERPIVKHAVEASAPVEPDLRAPDLLLEELERERTSAMHDIVATIQADQNRLIRADADQPLIIQGGPGTGKTVVGLHRAAYVMYRQREQQLAEQSVLVLGPNDGFVDYIRSVLPSLGESSAVQQSIDGLALTNLAATSRGRISVRAEDTRSGARLKGDPRMMRAIEQAVWSRVTPEPIQIGFGRFILKLGLLQVIDIVNDLRRRGLTYEGARQAVVEQVGQAMFEELAQRSTSVGLAKDDVDAVMTATKRAFAERELLNAIYPPLDPRQLVVELLASRDRLAAGGFDSVEVDELVRPFVPGAPYRWSRHDLPLIDEAASLIRGAPKRYGHVVVDEAQDLSPMQWRMIGRRTMRGSITILGDLAQGTAPWAADDWHEVVRRAGVGDRATVAELTLGYRVPQEVMELAGRLLPHTAPAVTQARSFRRTGDPAILHVRPHRIVREAVSLTVDEGSVAVIAPEPLGEKIAAALVKGGSRIGPTVLRPDAAKGLEFDTVIVVEPRLIALEDPAGLRHLYIGLTRPTKKLVILHSLGLPVPLRGTAGAADRDDRPHGPLSHERSTTRQSVRARSRGRHAKNSEPEAQQRLW